MGKTSSCLNCKMRMNMKKLIIISIVIFNSAIVLSQDYPLAPEVWSEPKRIEDIYVKGIDATNPSLTKNLDTMYLFIDSDIYRSNKENGKWRKPIRLNTNVNAGDAMNNSSISKDGRRIYYAAWGGYGSWDLWYNDWDTATNDWGPYHNLGSKLNSPSTDWYIYEISKDSLLILNDRVATPSPNLYVSDKNNWVIADSFYYSKLACCHVQGISMPKNKRKIYYADMNAMWNGGIDEHGAELCVVYWDTNRNYWGEPYFLNINSKSFQPDKTNPFLWIGGADKFPWVSLDGKTLFFDSNRDAANEDTSFLADIYVSYLLIDKNGNPVSTVNESNKIPNGYELYPNYPNPFNPSTRIRYTIPESTSVLLTVYNIQGKKVTELVNETKTAGEYEVEFNAGKFKLSSGIYVYQLRTRNAILTNKFTLIK